MITVLVFKIFLMQEAHGRGYSSSVVTCKNRHIGIVTKFNNVLPESKSNKVNDKYDTQILSEDIVFDSKIKCSYEFNRKEGEKIGILYSNVCANIEGNFEFITNISGSANTSNIVKIDSQTKKRIITKHSQIGFIWQIGECSEDSEKYYYKLKQELVTSEKKLLKNKFLLVSEDDKSLTYYANPGYVVKLEKNEKLCKKNKNCELNIVLKKHLSSAILDADGKLHTDAPL